MRRPTMTDEQLRELHEDVKMLIEMRLEEDQGPAFHMVRDEVTGRYDMVSTDARDDDDEGLEWGDYVRSPLVEAVIGTEAYQKFWPETFPTDVASDEELHLATLVQITAMSGGTPEAELAIFARDWMDLRRMIVRGQMREAYLRLDINVDGRPVAAFVTIEAAAISTVMLCQHEKDCGGVVGKPDVFWRDGTAFSHGMIEEIERDMIDLEILSEGIRISAQHLEAQRLQDLHPAGVIGLDAIRKFKGAIASEEPEDQPGTNECPADVIDFEAMRKLRLAARA